ncbi:MAG: protoglobin domain-containing protein [Planctomycetales bacterium]
MNADQRCPGADLSIAGHCDDLQALLEWTAADEARLKSAAGWLAPSFPSVVESFYDHILKLPAAAVVLKAEPSRIPRLKQTLQGWLDELFTAPVSPAKRERRYQVGRRHVELRLDLADVSGGFARLRMDLLAAIRQSGQPAEELWPLTESLNKALDVDLAVIQGAYHAAATAELTAARLETEAASNARSRFLASTSHELRTPLTAILGMIELLLDSKLAPEHRSYLSVIQQSAESLLGLISDVLDFARLEAGKLTLQPREFPLHDTLCGALKGMTFTAARKGLDLCVEVMPEVPEWAVGDPDRLRQVLLNLTGNAIKFTDAGRVVVRAEADCRTPQSFTLRLSVEDTGPGIPADEQARLFQPFERGVAAHRPGGTGLGLAISDRLIRAMGGRIVCESWPGKGSRFAATAELGVSAMPHAVQSSINHSSGSPFSVMIVEPHAPSRTLHEELVRRRGGSPVAWDSVEAALRHWAHGDRIIPGWKVALIDARTASPLLTDLVNLLWSAPSPPQHLVLLIRPVPDAEVSELAQRLRATRCLVPPVTLDELDQLLGAMRAPSAGLGTAGDQTGERASRLRILVADDQLHNQILFREWLAQDGHSVEVAGSGITALQALERAPFDVLLLDLHMPELDGLATVERIRTRDRASARHLPVLVMSAGISDQERRQCDEIGIDGYLAKPMRRNELRAALASIGARRGKPLDPSRPPKPPVTQAADSLGWTPQMALPNLEGNARLLRRLSEALCEEVPQLLERLHAAVRTEDRETWQCTAHGLKGAMQTLGAEQAAATAARLESLAASSATVSAPVRALVEELSRQVTAIVDCLREFSQTSAAGREVE